MIKKIREYAEIHKNIEGQLIAYFKDTNVPLETRWESFELAIAEEVFHNDRGYVWHNSIIEDDLNLCWYDDFYMERYSYKDFTEIMEILEDGLEEEPVYCAGERLSGKITREQVDQIKEAMLQSGYSGFTFDW